MKRSIERYRVRQVNLVRLTVSTGSPGPKNKSCTNKTYISYLRKAAKGPSDQPWVSTGGPWNPETPGEQIPDKICPLRRKLLNSPPQKRRGSDKRSNLIICLIYRGWNNGTLEIYDVSKKINAIGLCRKKHSIVIQPVPSSTKTLARTICIQAGTQARRYKLQACSRVGLVPAKNKGTRLTTTTIVPNKR